MYVPPEAMEGRRWPLRWADWASGDELAVTLTGGSSQKDSDGFGPGLSEVRLRCESLSFRAGLDGPTAARTDGIFQLALTLANQGDKPLKYSTRWLLPSGMVPTGQWDTKGPQGELSPGEELSAALEVHGTPETGSQDPDQPSGAAFSSLPLTLEVYIGPSSFWLVHQVMIPIPHEGDPS